MPRSKYIARRTSPARQAYRIRRTSRTRSVSPSRRASTARPRAPVRPTLPLPSRPYNYESNPAAFWSTAALRSRPDFAEYDIYLSELEQFPNPPRMEARRTPRDPRERPGFRRMTEHTPAVTSAGDLETDGAKTDDEETWTSQGFSGLRRSTCDYVAQEHSAGRWRRYNYCAPNGETTEAEG